MSLKLKIPPAAVTLICGLLMWVLDRTITIDNLTFGMPWWVHGLFFISGIVFGMMAITKFSKHATTIHPKQPEKATTLVRSGIYNVSRNPMYLGLLLMLLACAIYFGNLITFVVLPLFVWYMNRFQIIPEEHIMQQKFGAEYQTYRSSVRRWI